MRIVVSCGDVNGIGLEVFLKALGHPVLQQHKGHELTLYCESDCVQLTAEKLGIELQWNKDTFSVAGLRCHVQSCDQHTRLRFGAEYADAARLAIRSLELSAAAVCSTQADAVLTLPISKHSLQRSGFAFPGQTEFFAARAAEWHSSESSDDSVPRSGADALMMLVYGAMRVALATIHVPLQSVASLLSVQLLCERVRALENSLHRDFGCEYPRIAMLALNPHAGEHGAIGMEEQDILLPALHVLQNEGVDCEGPFAADGFFAHKAYLNYDAILAMYHDQGLIPLKLLASGGGVNFSANLPLVRCSPDHGTAYAIAGQGVADETSTVHALLSAISIAEQRANYDAAKLRTNQ